MKKVLRWLGIGLLAVVALVCVAAFVARFQDGPTVAFPGGPLETGAWAEPTWQDAGFLTDVAEIEFQLLSPPRSRTTWVLVHEGVAYIPCGIPNFKLWKQWPHQALADGRAVVRVDGVRHRRTAVRVEDPALRARLHEIVAEKYATPSVDPSDPDAVWFFRLDPRAG